MKPPELKISDQDLRDIVDDEYEVGRIYCAIAAELLDARAVFAAESFCEDAPDDDNALDVLIERRRVYHERWGAK